MFPTQDDWYAARKLICLLILVLREAIPVILSEHILSLEHSDSFTLLNSSGLVLVLEALFREQEL